MEAAMAELMCMGTNVVFVKLMTRPVAKARSCRMFFNCWAPSFDALAMIRVSSRIVGQLAGDVRKAVTEL